MSSSSPSTPPSFSSKEDEIHFWRERVREAEKSAKEAREELEEFQESYRPTNERDEQTNLLLSFLWPHFWAPRAPQKPLHYTYSIS